MIETHRGALAAGAALAIGTFLATSAGTAVAGSHVTQTLTATSHAPTAKGRAKLALKTAAKGRFRVVARGLAPASAFDLLIGGVKVATLTTNAVGGGKVKLGTNPRPSEGLLGVDPRGKSVEVRDDNGDDQLEGDMPDDGDSASGAFACCLPQDGHAECDVKTADECTGEGGTPQTGVTSCIPDPCGATPPGGEGGVVCCFPGSSTGAFIDEEAEAECDDTTSQECASAGGTVVQATSCEPNPCAAVPPSDVTVCCVADGSESECEILAADRCAAKGTPSSATSCEGDPCGGSGGDGGGSSDSGDGSGSDG